MIYEHAGHRVYIDEIGIKMSKISPLEGRTSNFANFCIGATFWGLVALLCAVFDWDAVQRFAFWAAIGFWGFACLATVVECAVNQLIRGLRRGCLATSSLPRELWGLRCRDIGNVLIAAAPMEDPAMLELGDLIDDAMAKMLNALLSFPQDVLRDHEQPIE